MQEGYIPHLVKVFTVGVPSRSLPDIYTLRCQFAVTEITVPSPLQVMALIYERTPPVEDLKPVFNNIQIGRAHV